MFAVKFMSLENVGTNFDCWEIFEIEINWKYLFQRKELREKLHYIFKHFALIWNKFTIVYLFLCLLWKKNKIYYRTKYQCTVDSRVLSWIWPHCRSNGSVRNIFLFSNKRHHNRTAFVELNVFYRYIPNIANYQHFQPINVYNIIQ